MNMFKVKWLFTYFGLHKGNLDQLHVKQVLEVYHCDESYDHRYGADKPRIHIKSVWDLGSELV